MQTLAKYFSVGGMLLVLAQPIWSQQFSTVQFEDTIVPSATEEGRSGLGLPGESDADGTIAEGAANRAESEANSPPNSAPRSPSGSVPPNGSTGPRPSPPPAEQLPASQGQMITDGISNGLPLSSAAEPSNQGPYLSSDAAMSGEITDSGLLIDSGQAYDLPVTDIMPTEAAEVYSTNNWYRGGKWYSQHEAMMWLRTDLPKVHIAIDRSNPATQTGLNVFLEPELHSSQGDFRYQPGMRMTVGRILGRDVANRDHGFEISFTGLFEYDGHARLVATNQNGAGIDSLLASQEIGDRLTTGVGFVTLNVVDGFSGASSQEFTYTADLNSLEINYTVGGRPIRDRLVMQPDGRWVRFGTPSNVRALFAGFRYLRQNENFEYLSFGGIDDASVAANNPVRVDERGVYRVSTDNNLTGIQFGADLTEKHTDWMAGWKVKVGGLANFADRKSSVRALKIDIVGNQQVQTNIARDQTIDDRNLTFLFETGVYFAYNLRPNTSLRVGYDMLYMNGLATATNNLGLRENFPVFEMTGDSFYHGLGVGLEAIW